MPDPNLNLHLFDTLVLNLANSKNGSEDQQNILTLVQMVLDLTVKL